MEMRDGAQTEDFDSLLSEREDLDMAFADDDSDSSSSIFTMVERFLPVDNTKRLLVVSGIVLLALFGALVVLVVAGVGEAEPEIQNPVLVPTPTPSSPLTPSPTPTSSPPPSPTPTSSPPPSPSLHPSPPPSSSPSPSPSPSPVIQIPDDELFRLPRTVIPYYYNISLEPYMAIDQRERGRETRGGNADEEELTFAGAVQMLLTVKEATDVLVMNSAELTFSAGGVSVMFSDQSNQQTSLKSLSFNEKTETVTFLFDEVIEPQNMSLSVKYVGILNRQMRGFYQSVWNDNDGKTHIIASTQFEATDARRAFPCFDEPSFKAEFQISLVHHSKYTALSNMPLYSTFQISPLKQLSVFEPSVRMSTYLVCFVVGEFENVTTSLDDRPISVWTLPGKTEQGKFARDIAKDSLHYYEELFGIDFPIGKLDLIAIPDFAAGAMENWGLVTFRQVDLLLDSKTASEASRQRVAIVVAHELAHQWFGNLVTAHWWGALWLHEGFASYFEHDCIDHLFPEWGMMEQMIVAQRYALNSDALPSSHSLDTEVITPNQISEMFDRITYEKGASVIRMAELFAGRDNFIAGLQRYLQTYQYGNAGSEDLWNSIRVGDETLLERFHNWTFERGVPLFSPRDGRDGFINLSQAPLNAIDNEDNNDSVLWWLPVPVVFLPTGASHTSTTYFQFMTKSETYPMDESAWAKYNLGQTGVYRTHYTNDQFESIVAAVSKTHGVLSTVDRAGLLNDALVLSRYGSVDLSVALDVAQAVLTGETEYVVWDGALEELDVIGYLLRDQDCYGDYEIFMQQLVVPALDSFVHKGRFPTSNRRSSKRSYFNPHEDAMLSAELVGVAVRYNMESVTQYLSDLFWTEVVNGAGETSIPNDLLPAIYYAGVALGDRQGYEAAFGLYMNTTDPIEKKRLLVALTATPRRYLLDRTLRYSLNETVVRPQDRSYVFAGVGNNPHGEALAWTFLRANWENFNRRGFSLGRYVQYTTRHFATRFQYNEAEEFFTANLPEGGESALSAALDTIEGNIAWLDRNSDSACRWLSERNARPTRE